MHIIWSLFSSTLYPIWLIVSVLHQEEGGIGKSIPDAQDFPRPERFPEGEARGKSRGSREILRDFPRPWVLHPKTRGISRGRSLREIPRVEGCKTHGQGKSRGRRGWIFHSFIIIREVLILTLSIFIPLQRCICLYPLATGMILNEMINSDHNIQSHPCPQRCTDQYCP